jgi:glycosyltransferase involved in cell wall biosynthesis
VNPIHWPEPFGLVMTESLACGTPVVGGSLGAASEIVDHGVTGFLADDVASLVDGLDRVERISRHACRQAVVDRFSSDRMAADYSRFYRQWCHARPVLHDDVA